MRRCDPPMGLWHGVAGRRPAAAAGATRVERDPGPCRDFRHMRSRVAMRKVRRMNPPHPRVRLPLRCPFMAVALLAATGCYSWSPLSGFSLRPDEPSRHFSSARVASSPDTLNLHDVTVTRTDVT